MRVQDQLNHLHRPTKVAQIPQQRPTRVAQIHQHRPTKAAQIPQHQLKRAVRNRLDQPTKAALIRLFQRKNHHLSPVTRLEYLTNHQYLLAINHQVQQTVQRQQKVVQAVRVQKVDHQVQLVDRTVRATDQVRQAQIQPLNHQQVHPKQAANLQQELVVKFVRS